jgi:hypothetical protein
VLGPLFVPLVLGPPSVDKCVISDIVDNGENGVTGESGVTGECEGRENV